MSSLARQLEASIANAQRSQAARNKAASQLASAHAVVTRALSALDAHRHGSRSLEREADYTRALERFHELAAIALGLEKT